MSAFQSASDTVATSPGRRMPALLTSTSQRPKALRVSPAAAIIPFASVTSQTSGTACAPACLASSAVRAQPSAARSSATIFAPTWANASAMARPIPLPAPVTTHTFSRSPSQSLMQILGTG